MPDGIAKVEIDMLNYPAIKDGKQSARLWFLMQAVVYERDDVPDDVRQTVNAACDMAKELERRVQSGAATKLERKAFEFAYDNIEPLAIRRYEDAEQSD